MLCCPLPSLGAAPGFAYKNRPPPPAVAGENDRQLLCAGGCRSKLFVPDFTCVEKNAIARSKCGVVCARDRLPGGIGRKPAIGVVSGDRADVVLGRVCFA